MQIEVWILVLIDGNAISDEFWFSFVVLVDELLNFMSSRTK